jgi:hypothetical protein
MSADNTLTPQQEFDKILSSAAVDIARMEQIRDDSGRPSSPAPAPTPPSGAVPNPNAGARPPANKDYQNNAIADKKAETLKKVDEISKNLSPEEKKGMQDKAYSTLYPPNKNDLNQIPKSQYPKDKDGKHLGDKEVDNAQERVNALKGEQAAKNQDKKADTAIDKSQDRADSLLSKNTPKDNPAAQKKEAKTQENKPEKDPSKNNTSTRFNRSLEGNKVAAKDVQNPSQEKVGSTNTRFSQTLSHNSPSPSYNVKTSPTPSGRD